MTYKSKYLFLHFSLVVSTSCVTSLSAFAVGHVVQLEETPLGFYQKKSLPKARSIPDSIELEMTPASNQGPLGTCASFTAVSCGEHFFPHHRFSAAEFTVLAETQLTPLESGDCLPGLYLGKALRVAQSYGFVDEKRLPYSSYLNYVAQKSGSSVSGLTKIPEPQICIKDPYSARGSYNTTMHDMGSELRLMGTTEDIGYRFTQLYPLHHVSHHALSLTLQGRSIAPQKYAIGTPAKADVDSVVTALSMNMPVAVALPVFDGCWDTKDICLPESWQKSIGWHAVTLTGYDLVDQEFTFKNSWGTSWGDDGFANIPFKYVKVYSSEMIAVGK